MNKSDSERIATVLESRGYQPASKINEADLIVVNMCSVRQSAVDRIFGLSQKFSKLKIKNTLVRPADGSRPADRSRKKLKIILTGCILKSDREKFKKEFDLILGIKDLPNWPKIFNKKCDVLFSDRNFIRQNYLKVQSKYSNNFSAFIPISNGCNNACVYCVVPFTRGPLVCRDQREILKEVKNSVQKGLNPIRNAISNGAREIWLLGQNVNDYQSPTDTSINFAKLLKMVNDIPGDFKFFFVSPHPKNFSDELIDTLAKCKKFGKYFNLPVQSGDDKILKKMNRNYTVKEYKNLVKKIRKKIPEIRLSTDVIVGFPGETKKQFQNTMNLFKEIKFNLAYIAKYSPRPGTVAALKMEDNVPMEEKKRREKCLREIINTRC